MVEKELALLWEVSAYEFGLVTIALGGGAAWMTGRAAANEWLPGARLALYMVLLAGAVRFIHFALFDGTLISPWYYFVDLAVLMAIAFASKRRARAGHMASQYGFAYSRAGPFGWTRRSANAPPR